MDIFEVSPFNVRGEYFGHLGLRKVGIHFARPQKPSSGGAAKKIGELEKAFNDGKEARKAFANRDIKSYVAMAGDTVHECNAPLYGLSIEANPECRMDNEFAIFTGVAHRIGKYLESEEANALFDERLDNAKNLAFFREVKADGEFNVIEKRLHALAKHVDRKLEEVSQGLRDQDIYKKNEFILLFIKSHFLDLLRAEEVYDTTGEQKQFNVNRVIEAFKENFRFAQSKGYKGIKTTTDLGSFQANVNMDPGLLFSILAGMYNNAAKHAGATKLKVTTRQRGGFIETKVNNNGKLVPNNFIQNPDLMFQRGESTGGSGIGLYVCKEVVEHVTDISGLKKGSVTLEESSTQNGTTFQILLPIYK